MDINMDNESKPIDRINLALTALSKSKRKMLVKEFCYYADKLGFTQEQVINMVKTIPPDKANK